MKRQKETREELVARLWRDPADQTADTMRECIRQRDVLRAALEEIAERAEICPATPQASLSLRLSIRDTARVALAAVPT